jgi:hypothetical protein
MSTKYTEVAKWITYNLKYDNQENVMGDMIIPNKNNNIPSAEHRVQQELKIMLHLW